MGVLYPFADIALATSESTLLFISIAITTYSLIIARSGTRNFRNADYVGILCAGLAGKLPKALQINVPKRLASFFVNMPGVVVPVLMYLIEMRFTHTPINNIVFMLFLSYYIQRLLLGIMMSGYSVNIGDVLAEFAVNFSIAYGQAASLCYLYDLNDRLSKHFYAAGILMYLSGFVMYLYHEFKLRNLETMFQANIPYARGGLFEKVVAPQLLGEILMVGGVAVATRTLCGCAHLIFISAYYMVISNMRYVDLSDRIGRDFNNRVKRLFPFVW